MAKELPLVDKKRIIGKKEADLWYSCMGVVNAIKRDPELKERYGGWVAELELAQIHFDSARAMAWRGAKSSELNRQKKQAKDELIRLLRLFADIVNIDAQGYQPYISRCGFRAQKAPKKHYGPLPTPRVEKVTLGSEPGSLTILLHKKEIGPGTKLIIMQYSTDKGATWLMGGAFTSLRMLRATGLPRSLDLYIRFQASGTRDRVSGWSSPYICTVL